MLTQLFERHSMPILNALTLNTLRNFFNELLTQKCLVTRFAQ